MNTKSKAPKEESKMQGGSAFDKMFSAIKAQAGKLPVDRVEEELLEEEDSQDASETTVVKPLRSIKDELSSAYRAGSDNDTVFSNFEDEPFEEFAQLCYLLKLN